MKSDEADDESETKTEIQKCDRPVSYTLVDTAAEPVPEPITAAGTALALSGLSWLKHKKKMAV
ncbi:PEP-CTERM sorting domain-containing protein [Tychonema sp. LEGE 07203]|uniref:PEP-CTERM sorting domain-containing protein n=1 Tax=Tychonema sp. LEGE 07203 TaxID=1828671 RepID=UPI0018802846|nr:PEP-CTERM sorting domain-containing protein [Tychonema sp. LEGE 07203]